MIHTKVNLGNQECNNCNTFMEFSILNLVIQKFDDTCPDCSSLLCTKFMPEEHQDFEDKRIIFMSSVNEHRDFISHH